jgi:hypothetical protein
MHSKKDDMVDTSVNKPILKECKAVLTSKHAKSHPIVICKSIDEMFSKLYSRAPTVTPTVAQNVAQIEQKHDSLSTIKKDPSVVNSDVRHETSMHSSCSHVDSKSTLDLCDHSISPTSLIQSTVLKSQANISNNSAIEVSSIESDIVSPKLPNVCSGGMPSTEYAPRSTVGVDKIWTHPRFRRHGIASRLVSTMLDSWSYGVSLHRHSLAFSQPTQAGRKFAVAFTGLTNFLAYS